MRFVGRLFAILIIILGMSFAALNAVSVPINYYLGTLLLPLSVLLLIAFVLGSLVTILLICFKICQLKIANKALKRELEQRGGINQ